MQEIVHPCVDADVLPALPLLYCAALAKDFRATAMKMEPNRNIGATLIGRRHGLRKGVVLVFARLIPAPGSHRR
jgi:hypothetical protein